MDLIPAALRPSVPSTTQSLTDTSAIAQPPHRRRVRDSFAALAAQEKTLLADPKWRKYSSLVDKCLQSFDNVNEWADFITFLAKLLKVRLAGLSRAREL